MAYDYSHAQSKVVLFHHIISLIFLIRLFLPFFAVPMSLIITKNFVVNNFIGCKTNLLAEKTELDAIEIKKERKKG